MSIFLQIGQCGNQLGKATFDRLYDACYNQNDEFSDMYKDYFFYTNPQLDKPIANVFSIDMEPKVISDLLNTNDKSPYVFSGYNCLNRQEGSGNNWAYGYYTHGPQNEDYILKHINHMAERQDNLRSINFLSSMAGGTGSGLGSYALTVLKDEFPKTSFVNFLVAPKKGGEIILQNYNTIFSLSSIYQNSDYIFILQNDRAHHIQKKMYGVKNIEITHLNELLSQNIASTLLLKHRESESKNNDYISVYKNKLTPYKHGKLLSTRFVPHVKKQHKAFSTETWFSLFKRAFQMQVCGSSEANINWNLNPKYSQNTVKAMATFLDCNSKTSEMDNKVIEKKDFFFKSPEAYHQKMNGSNYTINMNKRSLFDLPLSINMLSNSQEQLPFLELTYEKAKEQFCVDAYLFQYERNGLERDTVVDMFHYFRNIIDYYKDFQLSF